MQRLQCNRSSAQNCADVFSQPLTYGEDKCSPSHSIFADIFASGQV